MARFNEIQSKQCVICSRSTFNHNWVSSTHSTRHNFFFVFLFHWAKRTIIKMQLKFNNSLVLFRSFSIILLIVVPWMTRANANEKEVDRESKKQAKEASKKKCSVACSTVMRNLLERFIRFSSLLCCCVFIRWIWPPVYSRSVVFAMSVMSHSAPKKKREIITIRKSYFVRASKGCNMNVIQKKLYTKINACQWMKNHCEL